MHHRPRQPQKTALQRSVKTATVPRCGILTTRIVVLPTSNVLQPATTLVVIQEEHHTWLIATQLEEACRTHRRARRVELRLSILMAVVHRPDQARMNPNRRLLARPNLQASQKSRNDAHRTPHRRCRTRIRHRSPAIVIPRSSRASLACSTITSWA